MLDVIDDAGPASHRGVNKLFGTTAAAGSPDVAVPQSKVILFYPATTMVMRATGLSDAVGGFAFERVLSGGGFMSHALIALDPSGQYDPVCKTNLIPSPMPPDPSEHP